MVATVSLLNTNSGNNIVMLQVTATKRLLEVGTHHPSPFRFIMIHLISDCFEPTRYLLKVNSTVLYSVHFS